MSQFIKLQKCKIELNNCRKMLARKDKDFLKCTKEYAAYVKDSEKDLLKCTKDLRICTNLYAAYIEDSDEKEESYEDEIENLKIVVKELTKENKEKRKCDKEKFLLSVKCRRYQATIEKLKEKKKEPKKPRKGWFNVCDNELDLATTENFTADEKNSAARITLLDLPNQVYCIKKESLRGFFSSAVPMRNAIRNPGASRPPEPNTGFGYMPGKKKIWKLPMENIGRISITHHGSEIWITDKAKETILNAQDRHIYLVRPDNLTRLFNAAGTFGMSQMHGQYEVPVWKVDHTSKVFWIINN